MKTLATAVLALTIASCSPDIQQTTTLSTSIPERELKTITEEEFIAPQERFDSKIVKALYNELRFFEEKEIFYEIVKDSVIDLTLPGIISSIDYNKNKFIKFIEKSDSLVNSQSRMIIPFYNQKNEIVNQRELIQKMVPKIQDMDKNFWLNYISFLYKEQDIQSQIVLFQDGHLPRTIIYGLSDKAENLIIKLSSNFKEKRNLYDSIPTYHNQYIMKKELRWTNFFHDVMIREYANIMEKFANKCCLFEKTRYYCEEPTLEDFFKIVNRSQYFNIFYKGEIDIK